ncbi:hypothetical protein LEMLEM_LOCUS22415 [Lemmus lemmus]
MVASSVSQAMAFCTCVGQHVAFIRKIPWTTASSELREHFAQFSHLKGTMYLLIERLAFTEAYVGFSFLQRKNFRMHYNRKAILLIE